MYENSELMTQTTQTKMSAQSTGHKRVDVAGPVVRLSVRDNIDHVVCNDDDKNPDSGSGSDGGGGGDCEY